MASFISRDRTSEDNSLIPLWRCQTEFWLYIHFERWSRAPAFAVHDLKKSRHLRAQLHAISAVGRRYKRTNIKAATAAQADGRSGKALFGVALGSGAWVVVDDGPG